ncbi:MAG: SRPBCC family protein [Nitrososphaerales archaeon]
MPKIVGSIEIDASKDRVWEVISDLDNEADYWWGTKEVRNISKDGNVLNREIIQNFRNHKILQKVILTPKNEIETRYLKGLTEGVRLLKQETISENKQKVTATWDVRFPGIYILLSYFIARHIRKGTSDALARIKEASEGTRSTSGN